VRQYAAFPSLKNWRIIHPCAAESQLARNIQSQIEERVTAMNESKQASISHDNNEMTSLLLGAGFALASLIILPALAQRIGLGSSLTIALRGALMRAANRV
jgi:hypothetical protein